MALRRQWSICWWLTHVAGDTDIGIGHDEIIRSKYVNMSQGAAAWSKDIAESALFPTSGSNLTC